MKLMAKPNLFYLTIFAMLIALSLSISPRPTAAQSTIPETPFSLEALGNTTYRNAYSATGEVTLENGQVTDETNRLFVSLTGYVAYGDLTGDGVDEAAVVLVTNSGGTGNFYDLAVLVDDNGTLTNVATTLLGDRIALHDLAIVDGQISVDLTTQGPGDAACCPTLPVQRRYTLDGDTLTMSAEETKTSTATAGVFAPDADATVATLNLGGANFWLDPMLVSLHGGAVTGPAVRANTLGQGCAGTIDERPDVVLNWSADEAVATLRIFLLSMGDPSLVVVTPTGEIICNDDLNPLMLDPYLEVADPQPGRYAIYLGSFEGDVTTPGFLVVTSQELSPATLDLAQLFPHTVNPGAVAEPQPLDVLALDAEPMAAPSAPLTVATTPYTATVVAGGELGAYAIELDNDLCTGFIAATPTFAFDWAGEGEQLALFFAAAADTTLVVRDPNGAFQCNDDADDDANLNPYLDLPALAGRYTLWVGSFAPTTLVTGTLTIATDPDLRPTPLTAAMAALVETSGAPSVLSLQALRNATYSGIYDEPVTLTDGVYEEADPPVSVRYRDNATLFGDLDGDAMDDAVVFLTDSGGGSATFTYVAAQVNQNGQPVDAGAVMLEDRTQIKSATIKDNQLVLEFTTAGPGDGACCPSHLVRKTYGLQDGKLAEIADHATEPVRVSPADLDGTRWRLVELGENKPVTDAVEITIAFAGDQISGSGGCNNYTSSFTLSNDNPFLITISPIAATRMLCPEPTGSTETAYLSALGAATIWGYDFGNLVLSHGEGEARDRLLFVPQPAAAAMDASLTGVTWQWVGLTDPMQQVTIDTPQSYTLTFLDDGTVQIQADCNQATASYAAADGSLTVTPGITTLALCGPASHSEELIQKLGFAAHYFFQDGHLFIDLMADGGTLEFQP